MSSTGTTCPPLPPAGASMSAYFATVFRLTWSTLAISDLERPGASIDRISFTVSRGTVISSILPGRARQSNRPGKPYGEGRAPGPRGAALLLKLLNFSCSRCSFPSDHSDHLLVNINKMARHRGRGVDLSVQKLRGTAARTVRDGFAETLAYTEFPPDHWRRIRTNNGIERINREIRRRTRVVGTFPDGNSALMLVTARLKYIAEHEWGKRRYPDMSKLEEMDKLRGKTEG